MALCAFALYSEDSSAIITNSVNNYRLTTTVNFLYNQCPVSRRYASSNRCRGDDANCLIIPSNHRHHYYNAYKSIFQYQQPLRPFNFQQQLVMLELFDALGITEHMHDLITMVNLTQYKNLSELTKKQLAQATDWREIEGETVQETACLNDGKCKEKVSTALFKMGMYDSQIPRYQHYDYTILLGGSIQQMQWRMLMLLSLYRTSLKQKEFDLGKIVALTCNRSVHKKETHPPISITMFDVNYTSGTGSGSGRAKAFINEGQEALLTETTSFHAIMYSLKRMSESQEYFERFQETTAGYHSTLPVSFLAINSYERKLYRKVGFTFQLSTKLPKLLRRFFARYPEIEVVETSMQRKGENLKKRPTTKLTVKEWLERHNNRLSCKDPKFCKILLISNAPNTFYQHIAALQAFEESISGITDLVYEISTAGPAASLRIPTNILLDNITKQLYLEAYHPED